MITVKTLKLTIPALSLIIVAALFAGYYLQAAGVLFGATVFLLNFKFLEKIITSINSDRFYALKMIIKTLVTVAVLFAGVIYLGAPGIFAGIFAATISVFAAGLKKNSRSCRMAERMK